MSAATLESIKAGNVTLEMSQYGRPFVYIAKVQFNGGSNSCVFSNRAEAIRWAKFGLRENDWSKWVVPQGSYPNETARDDETLNPTFIATYGTSRAEVSQTEVVQTFDWWAKEADGNWNTPKE